MKALVLIAHGTVERLDDLPAFLANIRRGQAAPEEIVQINRPPATYELSEHTIALNYPEYAAPTAVCKSFEEVLDAVRALPGEVVLKPENTYCGIGITFVEPSVEDEVLQRYWEKWDRVRELKLRKVRVLRQVKQYADRF